MLGNAFTLHVVVNYLEAQCNSFGLKFKEEFVKNPYLFIIAMLYVYFFFIFHSL